VSWYSCLKWGLVLVLALLLPWLLAELDSHIVQLQCRFTRQQEAPGAPTQQLGIMPWP
jgi:hypothetical protein